MWECLDEITQGFIIVISILGGIGGFALIMIGICKLSTDTNIGQWTSKKFSPISRWPIWGLIETGIKYIIIGAVCLLATAWVVYSLYNIGHCAMESWY